MFIHNFKYAFKVLFRNKSLIFWTFAFPIILAVFFNMAFKDIESNEKLDIIDIAIIDNDDFNNNQVMKETFKILSDDLNDQKLFKIQYTDLEDANNLLQDNEIIGYLHIENNKSNIIIKANGINQTIFKYVVEEINQNIVITDELAKKEISKQIGNGNKVINYEEIYKNIASLIQKEEVNVKNTSSNNLSYTMIEFYTLIAMTCLYGGILGTVCINKNLANMSSNGKRVSITPISKGKIIFSSVLASYIVQTIGVTILLLFTTLVLNVNYGENLLLIIVLALVGSLAGLSLGVFVGTVFKTNENTKTGIIISFTMLACFFSGMMGISLKYIIDKNVPFINKINPASMITDGFYSLYYYDTMDRYIFNVVSLLVFSLILLFIAFMSLRRQKYDSI